MLSSPAFLIPHSKLESFGNILVSYDEVLRLRPTPHARGPPLVGCPGLLSRYRLAVFQFRNLKSCVSVRRRNDSRRDGICCAIEIHAAQEQF